MSNGPLYVSDLDFTLLRSDATLSPRTVEVVNALLDGGGRFTVASARSPSSAMRVTAQLRLTLPLITYGGAVLVDPTTGATSGVVPVPTETVAAVIAATADHHSIEPLLFAMIAGRDRVCWRRTHTTPFTEDFVSARAGNPRLLAVDDWSELGSAPVFYVTVIGERDDIAEVHAALTPALADCFVTVGSDGYHPTQTWCEMTSRHGTKAAASRRLADQLGAPELLVFGDNRNDVPLFEVADHGCAVANAVPELLAIADEVIAGNDDDGVAAWLSGQAGRSAR